MSFLDIISFGIRPAVTHQLQKQEEQRDARAQAILSGLESFDRTYAALPGDMDAGQQAFAGTLYRQRNDAQVLMASGDRQLIARGLTEFDEANDGLRDLVRALPIDEAQKRAHLAELQARADILDPAETVDRALPDPFAEQQRQEFQKRTSQIQQFEDMARRLNNPTLMAEAEKRNAELQDDVQMFHQRQTAANAARSKEHRDNIKAERLLAASNQREFQVADRLSAIEYGEELSKDALKPLNDIQKFYDVIMAATDPDKLESVDLADIVMAGIAYNKLFNPQAEASDAAVQLATGNLSTDIFGIEFADMRDDFARLDNLLLGRDEVSRERIKDIRRSATNVLNQSIKAAQRTTEDIAARAAVALRFPDNMALVGLERMNSFKEIPVAKRAPRATPALTFKDQTLGVKAAQAWISRNPK